MDHVIASIPVQLSQAARRSYRCCAQVLAHAGLADVDAELEQFAVNAWAPRQDSLGSYGGSVRESLADYILETPPWLTSRNERLQVLPFLLTDIGLISVSGLHVTRALELGPKSGRISR